MKSHYGMKFVCMMQFTMKRITVWNGHTQQIFTFSDLGRPGVLFSERLVVRMWIAWYCNAKRQQKLNVGVFFALGTDLSYYI